MATGNRLDDYTPLEQITTDFDYSYHPAVDTWWIKLPGVDLPAGILTSEHGVMVGGSGITLARPIGLSGSGLWNVVNNDFIKVG